MTRAFPKPHDRVHRNKAEHSDRWSGVTPGSREVRSVSVTRQSWTPWSTVSTPWSTGTVWTDDGRGSTGTELLRSRETGDGSRDAS
jgi:hypothetical protein